MLDSARTGHWGPRMSQWAKNGSVGQEWVSGGHERVSVPRIGQWPMTGWGGGGGQMGQRWPIMGQGGPSMGQWAKNGLAGAKNGLAGAKNRSVHHRWVSGGQKQVSGPRMGQ